MKKFKLIHKTGKIFKDKRGSLQKILEGEFSSCIEVHSKNGPSSLRPTGVSILINPIFNANL